jgi:hypothetical protein
MTTRSDVPRPEELRIHHQEDPAVQPPAAPPR